MDPAKLRDVVHHWRAGRRPLDACLVLADVDVETLLELHATKAGWPAVAQERAQNLEAAGLSHLLTHWTFPPMLMDAPALSLADRMGLQHLAFTTHLALSKGMRQDEIAVRLAFVHDTDLESMLRLVMSVALHTRPDLRAAPAPASRSALWMTLALTLPLGLFLLVKSLVPAVSSDTIGLTIGFGALLGFPLLRRHWSNQAVHAARAAAPDGLFTLARDDRKPILYLRSHVVDGTGRESDTLFSHFLNTTRLETIEQKLSAVVRHEGPMVALEGPREGLPNLGADRIRLPDVQAQGWQALVQGLMVRAQLVVIRFRPTRGTSWEVGEALRTCPSHLLVFVMAVPGEPEAVRDASWQVLRPLVQACTGTPLPQRLADTDYCLGFDEHFNAKLFGARSRVLGQTSAFLESVVDAAGFGNPGFDEDKARLAALAAA